MPLKNQPTNPKLDRQLALFIEMEEQRLLSTGKISTTDYIRQTSHLAAPEGERLRKLAIALERPVYPDLEAAQHWDCVSSIYRRAIERNPNEVNILTSFGISAKVAAQSYKWSQAPKAVLQRVTQDALTAFESAVSIEEDAHTYYSWGLFAYDILLDYPLATEKFRRSIELDPSHYLARMYLGHCYFDQKSWLEAADCFRKIAKKDLVQSWKQPWRFVLLLELQSVCYAELGEEAFFRETFARFTGSCTEFAFRNLEEPRWLLQCCTGQNRKKELRTLQEISAKIRENRHLD